LVKTLPLQGRRLFPSKLLTPLLGSKTSEVLGLYGFRS